MAHKYDFDSLLENLRDMQNIIEGTMAMDEDNYSEQMFLANIDQDMTEVFRLLTLTLPKVDDIRIHNENKLRLAGRTKEDLMKEIEIMKPVVDAAIRFYQEHPAEQEKGQPYGCPDICDEVQNYQTEIEGLKS